MNSYMLLADIDWTKTGESFLGKAILIAVVMGVVAAFKVIALPADPPSATPDSPREPGPGNDYTPPSPQSDTENTPTGIQPAVVGHATPGYMLAAFAFVFCIVFFALWVASYMVSMAITITALPLLLAAINLTYALSMKFELAGGTLTIKRFPFIQKTIRVASIQRIGGRNNHGGKITPLFIGTTTGSIKVPPWLENQAALEHHLWVAMASRGATDHSPSSSAAAIPVDIKEIVRMAKEHFVIEPHQMNRPLYRALGVPPAQIFGFIDILEEKMNLIPKGGIHVKECSVEDIIRSLS